MCERQRAIILCDSPKTVGTRACSIQVLSAQGQDTVSGIGWNLAALLLQAEPFGASHRPSFNRGSSRQLGVFPNQESLVCKERTLLVAKGIATRSGRTLLRAPGITTRNKKIKKLLIYVLVKLFHTTSFTEVSALQETVADLRRGAAGAFTPVEAFEKLQDENQDLKQRSD